MILRILPDIWKNCILIWFDPNELNKLRLVCKNLNEIVQKSPMYITLKKWRKLNETANKKQNEWWDKEFSFDDCIIIPPKFGFIYNHAKKEISKSRGWYGMYGYYSSNILLTHAITYNALRIMGGLEGLSYTT